MTDPHDLPRPGHIPASPDLADEDRFQAPAEQPSMADLAWAHNGMPDMSRLPADPRIQRVSSGSPFNPVQFADHLEAAYTRRSAPLVHGPDKTTWYGEGDRDDR